MGKDQLHTGHAREAIALKRAWNAAERKLKGLVPRPTYEAYVRPIVPLRLDGSTVTLGVTSSFAREWLRNRCADEVRRSMEAALGHAVEVHYEVLPQEQPPLFLEESPAGPLKEAVGAEVSLRGRVQRPEWLSPVALNEDYTFESFVVGHSSQLAFASAKTVAAAPGLEINPLFIYGRPGLGKTHLLHAVTHALRKQHPRLTVGYVDGEEFSFRYAEAAQTSRVEAFRRFCDATDVWLVDDFQFIAGNEQVREEFFYLFYRLCQQGRQIVVASDRSPQELPGLEERVRTRFEGGLIVEVGPPDLETRMAILERRCAGAGWQVPREVVYYLANSIRSNVRSLAGALLKLTQAARLLQAPITVELAQEQVGEYLIERPTGAVLPKSVPLDAVIAAVAEQFSLDLEEMSGPRRDRLAVTARQIAFLLAHRLSAASLVQIGAALGGRDHATVKRGILRIEQQVEEEPAIRMAVQQARERLER